MPLNNITLISLNRQQCEMLSEILVSLFGGVKEMKFSKDDPHHRSDLSRGFLLAIYRELFTYIQECGQCDHSVNICYCKDKGNLQGLAELLGFVPSQRYDYEWPNPDKLEEMAQVLLERHKETEWILKYGGAKGGGNFRRMKVEEVFELKPGDHIWIRTSDGARIFKVNGKLKTWKSKPKLDNWELPVKYGLRTYERFDRGDLDRGTLLVEVQLPFQVCLNAMDEYLENDWQKADLGTTSADEQLCQNPNCRSKQLRIVQLSNPMDKSTKLLFHVCPNCKHQQEVAIAGHAPVHANERA